MSRLSTGELLQLRELLQMETNAVAKAKATATLVRDEELGTLVKSGIQASEARIKGIQKCIHDSNIISPEVQ